MTQTWTAAVCPGYCSQGGLMSCCVAHRFSLVWGKLLGGCSSFTVTGLAGAPGSYHGNNCGRPVYACPRHCLCVCVYIYLVCETLITCVVFAYICMCMNMSPPMLYVYINIYLYIYIYKSPSPISPRWQPSRGRCLIFWATNGLPS